MIALPFNDRRCMGTITEIAAKLVQDKDPVIVELASRFTTVESLVEWIRSLPQRDDEGDPDDGPRVEGCEPSQRLRIGASDMNCVERSATFLAVAELIDPNPVRQLATLDTPIGLHTFPVENGAPVILDPRVPRNCLDCGVRCLTPSAAIDTRDAIDWTVQLAEAGAVSHRNGPSRVRRARNAIVRLVDEGTAPADVGTVDSIALLLALAEHVARNYGTRALAIVRHTALALAETLDEALARTQRNLALEIAGTRLQPAPWVSMLARIAGRVGVGVGAAALNAKLKSLGVGSDLIGFVEEELNREGLTLGELAKPRHLPTLANFTPKRAA